MSGKRTTTTLDDVTATTTPSAETKAPRTSTCSTYRQHHKTTHHHSIGLQNAPPHRQHSMKTRSLTRKESEHEPRRSVRATKGQHTKAFDQLENGPEPKRKQTKKGSSKKAAEKNEKQEEDDEVIRCICGATTQDDDETDEPWIACDGCGVWQHCVCVDMSVYIEDLTRDYFCERCAPTAHKNTLDAIKRGEKPWEARRQKYEEEKKKKKGGRKSKGKRTSDPKERASPSAASTKAKPSPVPDTRKDDGPGESATGKGKRKSRDHSQGPQSKLRKVSEAPVEAAAEAPVQEAAQPAPIESQYTPPKDLPSSIDRLEDTRKQVAAILRAALDVAMDAAEKDKLYAIPIPSGSSKKKTTERLAIEIERAFHDTHTHLAHNASVHLVRALAFALKNNPELAERVFNRSLSPASFAQMTGIELATKEKQLEDARMKARAEKQSILINDDGPRIRKTLKGEEVVEPDHVHVESEESSFVSHHRAVRDTVETGKAKETREASEATNGSNEVATASAGTTGLSTNANTRSGSAAPLRVDTQAPARSRKSDFDIGKVFSSVKSPSSHARRPSQVQSAGPGEDADVDRLLQEDGNDSDPYSPSEHLDPGIVWRGPLVMTNITENLDTVARHVGGADLSQVRNIPWPNLIPPLLTVAGRISETRANFYLLRQRENNQVDLVITSLTPSHPSDPKAHAEFLKIINYFHSKERYGVVGERKLGGVRDTYLIPIPEGDGPLPELLQNIHGHLVPLKRSEPMLLMVFVHRDENIQPQSRAAIQQPDTSVPQTASPAPAPTWSPSTPQGQTPGSYSHPQSHYNQTPVPLPRIPGQPAPVIPPAQAPSTSQAPIAQDPDLPSQMAAQAQGVAKAREVLGDLFNVVTVKFLLPHAARMKEGEWTAVRRALERDPRACEDLVLLSRLLTEEGNNAKKNGVHPNPIPNGVVQTTLAAATATGGSAPAAQST
ncbi:hypothetical protein M426DRAFT_18105 [Hypoxylon sp. CI-4A]|nr:hypothetical protein M426DRAFT_18105 [Hypoxylon sp. CI-4A]